MALSNLFPNDKIGLEIANGRTAYRSSGNYLSAIRIVHQPGRTDAESNGFKVNETHRSPRSASPNQICWLRINANLQPQLLLQDSAQKISDYDGLRFTDAKDGKQVLPPTAVVGFNSEAGAAKNRSPVANIDPDRALISFEEMQIAPVEASNDARDVARREIRRLAVERAAFINHF